MASRLTDERCEAIAQAYYESGYNKTNGLKAIKKADGTQFYSESYCRSGLGHRLYDNIRIKAAIEQIRAKMEQKFEHIQQRLDWLDKKAKEGNVQAIQAQTGIIREMDSISGLNIQNIHTTTEQQRELSESEAKMADDIANIINLKDLKSG